jgi:serine/threonine protein kinase
MGVVYEAQQISMGRQVALKVWPFAALANEMPLRRFRNEVRAVATLEHPNIVTVYSIGEERGVHYYAMQLIRGRSLAETIELLARLTNGPQQLDDDSISRLLDSNDPSRQCAGPRP